MIMSALPMNKGFPREAFLLTDVMLVIPEKAVI